VNAVEKAARRVDAVQQRHLVTAFPVAVVKKYTDDNGGVLVANLAYASFISIFPLLLILVTVLVNIAASDPSLRTAVIGAATRQFPLVGHELASNVHALRRATTASLIVGLLLLLWGVTRLAQAGLYAMEQVWNLPGPARPGYASRLGRSVAFLSVLTLGLIISTLLAGLVTYGRHEIAFRMLAQVLAMVANIGLYALAFRVLTPRAVRTRWLLPGAVAGGTFWTILQAVGAYLVHHYLGTNSVYGIFATVLGLLAWIYLSVEGTVLAAEINVVLARRLWPRAFVQPPLTEADRTSMALQALQNQRREEQDIEVTFNDRPLGAAVPDSTPRRPQDVVPSVDIRS
jgi:YihY family inner membrane protein